jgi:hypothetical protein
MTTPASVAITTDVKNCARCGGAHNALEFAPLSNPPDDITHWALCPTTQEPILLTVTEAP